MKQGTYIGPDVYLNGEKALLRPGPNEDSVLAQFDSFSAHDSGGLMAFGWTEFPITSFRIDENDEDD